MGDNGMPPDSDGDTIASAMNWSVHKLIEAMQDAEERVAWDRYVAGALAGRHFNTDGDSIAGAIANELLEVRRKKFGKFGGE